MTPLGNPVVPLENGRVARSSKTLKGGDRNSSGRLLLIRACQSEWPASPTVIALVQTPDCCKVASVRMKSDLQIHKSGFIVSAT